MILPTHICIFQGNHKSFQISLKAFSIQAITKTQEACQQYKPQWDTVHTEGILVFLKLLSQLTKLISTALYKFPYPTKKKGITKKPLYSGASCLLDTSSPPGSLSLREMHSRIPHLASSLVDCDCKLHNTGCWIHLWRIRKAPSPRKHVLLFPNVPCIWKGKSLSPKDSIRPSANEEKFATVNSANC